MENTQDIVALVGFRAGPGGVGNVMRNLATGLARHGQRVDLLLGAATHPDLADAQHPLVRQVPVGAWKGAGLAAGLARYLASERPRVVLTNKEAATRAAVVARWAARVPTRHAIRLGNPLSATLARRHVVKRVLRELSIRAFYPRADLIIAISEGIREECRERGLQPEDRLVTLANPTLPDEDPTPEAIAHPWLAPGGEPLLVAAGRLAPQKDFPTLLNAFALLQSEIPSRLVIFGEGKDRGDLESLVRELGLESRVDLPGYDPRFVGFVRRASLFVLSSRWEGAGNVLIEALGKGVPVVATDCPWGPREILEQGRLGTLVPMGAPRALAEAMRDTLRQPPDPGVLRAGVQKYRVLEASQRYHEVLAALARGM